MKTVVSVVDSSFLRLLCGIDCARGHFCESYHRCHHCCRHPSRCPSVGSACPPRYAAARFRAWQPFSHIWGMSERPTWVISSMCVRPVLRRGVAAAQVAHLVTIWLLQPNHGRKTLGNSIARMSTASANGRCSNQFSDIPWQCTVPRVGAGAIPREFSLQTHGRGSGADPRVCAQLLRESGYAFITVSWGSSRARLRGRHTGGPPIVSPPGPWTLQTIAFSWAPEARTIQRGQLVGGPSLT